jgi:sugar lactone lactonase YvrE
MRVIGSVWTMLLVTTTVLSAQTITQEPTNQAVLAGGTVVFNVAVSGTGPFTYQWQCNGTNIPNNLITTVAGNGTNGLYGDGGVATNAGVPYPTGVAVDQTGNLFISEALSCRVRKVNTNGIITTIAGTGVSGSSGDGGLATNAQMRRPYGLALDAAGNLYIADTNSCCVRKVDTNGIITTAAGTAGTSNFSGDGGLATSAKISGAYGIAADRSGDLFIADLKNYRIRKVDTNGIINTVAGCGLTYKFTNDVAATNCMLPFPISVAVDHLGQLFIGEWFAQRIRKVDTNGIITVLAGTNTGIFSGKGGYSGDNGPATNAALYNPTGLAVDPSGNVFIADGENHRIRMVDTNGIITTVVGKGKIGYSGDGGTATNARLSNTYIIGLFDVAIDAAGNLFIADFGNHRVRKVWFGGSPTLILNDVSAANAGDYQVIITGAFGSITSSVVTLTVTQPPSILNQPRSQTVFPGNSASFNVAAFGASPLSYQWQKDGSNLAEGDNISGSTSTNLILTAATTGDAGGYSVVVTNAYGSVTSRVSTLAIVPAGCSIIVNPSSLSVWQGSNATLTSSFVGAGAVTYQWQHDGTNIPSQIITTVAGTGTNGFSGDGGPATNASLNYPEGLAVDSSGNLYIADSGNHRLRKMDLDNVITTVAGNGGSGVSGDGGAATNAGLKQPYGIGVDASGDLFISEKYNYVVRKVSTGGIITTVAGNGTSYSDYFDDILATNSHLDYPAGLAVDVAGNLFVADNGNDRGP